MTYRWFLSVQRTALTLLAIGVVVGGVLAQGCVGDEEDPLATFQSNMMIYERNTAGSWIPAPSTLEDLLDKSEAIVIGKVTSIQATGNLKSYNEADNVRLEQWLDKVEEDTGTRPPAGYPPYTDFLVEIEKIILNNGKLSVGEPLVLRMLGKAGSTPPAEGNPVRLRLLNDGETRLFTLGRNPDGTYGLYGWWSHFVIDGSKVTFSDDLRTPIHFTDKVAPADFVKALEDAVAARSES